MLLHDVLQVFDMFGTPGRIQPERPESFGKVLRRCRYSLDSGGVPMHVFTERSARLRRNGCCLEVPLRLVEVEEALSQTSRSSTGPTKCESFVSESFCVLPQFLSTRRPSRM